MRLTRRGALLGLGCAMTLGRAALALARVPTERRFVVVLLRGGMDGLSVLVPHGDRDLAAWRAPLVPAGLLDLGGFWGLHPALPGLHDMYAAGEALAVQSVAGPDRSRSHFAAQDALELGNSGHGLADGWLNRVAGAIGAPALAVGAGVPLLLRGRAPVDDFLPEGKWHAPADYYAMVLALNRSDRLTGPAMERALHDRGVTAAALAGAAPPSGQAAGFATLASAAGRLLAAPNGPRIAALEADGWDTHVRQAPRLGRALARLDAGLVALRQGLGDAWRQTAVLVVTEFGRTVRMNGSEGTDHGTATVAFVLGGAVAGGRVAGTWPGLAAGRLLDHRDLSPTTDVRAVAKGVLAQHLGLDEAALARVFPASDTVGPMHGLLHGVT